jgi:uncharacterized membrane protein YagU involved in acid resistance
MLGLSLIQYLRAALAGFFATFVMTVAGYWQQGVGLPRVDAAEVLSQNARRSKLWGSYAHYMHGIILALGYARWFEPMLRGPAMLKGALYGLATTLLADGLIMPLIDPRVGPFFSRTPRPTRLRAASLLVHLAYGLALGTFYADRNSNASREPARAPGTAWSEQGITDKAGPHGHSASLSPERQRRYR